MVEAVICQVKMFFKKTIIKNHVFCLSSCDVVTFAVRIATVSNFRVHNKHLKNPVFTSENECHKTTESQIISKTCWIGARFL